MANVKEYVNTINSLLNVLENEAFAKEKKAVNFQCETKEEATYIAQIVQSAFEFCNVSTHFNVVTGLSVFNKEKVLIIHGDQSFKAYRKVVEVACKDLINQQNK